MESGAFGPGDDPYASCELMKKIARATTQRQGGWRLASRRRASARVLRWRRNCGVRESATVLGPFCRARVEACARRGDRRHGGGGGGGTIVDGLVDWYASQMHDDDAPPGANSVGASALSGQQARTLALHKPLRVYLETGAACPPPPVVARSTICATAAISRSWIACAHSAETGAGLALLSACGVHPDAITVDHVWPRAIGGPHHLLFHVMPARTNSHIWQSQLDGSGKGDYVGPDQIECVGELVLGGRDTLAWNEIA